MCSVLGTIISAVATLSNLAISTNVPSIRQRRHGEEHRTQNATHGLRLL